MSSKILVVGLLMIALAPGTLALGGSAEVPSDPVGGSVPPYVMPCTGNAAADPHTRVTIDTNYVPPVIVEDGPNADGYASCADARSASYTVLGYCTASAAEAVSAGVVFHVPGPSTTDVPPPYVSEGFTCGGSPTLGDTIAPVTLP